MVLYNSLSRKKEKFIPLNKNKVKVYVCGITPYDTTHLGHAFTYVIFDVLVRYLEFKGYSVTYVQNVTDIDDDILRKAKEVGRDWRELGEYWTKLFLEDLKTMNVRMPDHYVKATDAVDEIILITKSLLHKGLAYEVSGNVYFSRKKFAEYGKLSRFTEKQMLLTASERGGDIADKKKNDPLDFLLWQESLVSEPSWDSPWSKGRPGWHIECSAMIHQHLGSQIDIHGGGRDLIFPHHESEIAQSESYSGKKPFVKYWLHAAMLQYEGEKMSKSLGNLVMVRGLLKKYSPNAIRWVLLSHHYRIPWEFRDEELQRAEEHVEFIINVIKKTKRVGERYETIRKQFESYMDDDLQTGKALDFLITLGKKQKNEALAELFPLLGFIT